MEGIEQPNQERISTFWKKGSHKFLALSEEHTIKEAEMKGEMPKNTSVEQQQKQQQKKLLETKLCKRNLINPWLVLRTIIRNILKMNEEEALINESQEKHKEIDDDAPSFRSKRCHRHTMCFNKVRNRCLGQWAVNYNNYNNHNKRRWIERWNRRHCQRTKKLLNINVTGMPILINALGTIQKGFIKGLEDLEIRGQVETIQTTILFRSFRIQRKVMKTWGGWLSLKLQ